MDEKLERIVLGPPQDISDLRGKVLSHIEQFEAAIKVRADTLRESKQFLYFEKEINQFLSVLDDLIEAIQEENIDDFVNVEANVWKHEYIQAEISSHESEMVKLEQQGLYMIKNLHRNSYLISKKIRLMKQKWQNLLSAFTDQTEILQAKQYYVKYLRSYEKITRWINKKTDFLTTKNIFKSLESIEEYIYEFGQLERKIKKVGSQVDELKTTSDFFIKDDLPKTYNISEKKETLIFSWRVLRDMVSAKREQISDFKRLHRLCCRVNEFLAWMAQKNIAFSKEDYGNNLEEHLLLLKKHEGIERLLCDMIHRLRVILQEYDSLQSIIQVHTEGIIVERGVIEQNWKNLETKALKRGMMLKNRSKIHKFFVDINCSIQAIAGMKMIIASADDQGKAHDADIPLQMLAIYRDVIEKNEDDLEEIVRSGHQLLKYDQQLEEINEKLEELQEARSSLKGLLDAQEKKCKHLMALQVFDRDCDTTAHWLEQKLSSLDCDTKELINLDIVQGAMRKHEMFKYALMEEKRRIENLICTKIEAGFLGDLEVGQILQKQEKLKSRLEAVEAKTEEKSKVLMNAFKLLNFHHDCDDIQQWLVGNLNRLCKDYDLDATLISANIESHKFLVDEFTAYSKVINKLVEQEEEMIEIDYFQEGKVKDRVKTLVDGWNTLSFEAYDKTLKMEEVLDSRTFILISTKLEMDFSEFEDRLGCQYVYHDGEISRAFGVLKKLEILEFELSVMQKRFQELQKYGNMLVKNEHYDSEGIAGRIKKMRAKQYYLVFLLEKRQKTIKDARAVGDLYMKIEEQAACMKEMIPKLSVDKIGIDLFDVQHLITKHKMGNVQLIAHTKEVRKLRTIADKMIKAKHYDSCEISKRISELLSLQEQLRNMHIEFKLKLEERQRIIHYLTEAGIAMLVMNEKRTILTNPNCGENEDKSAAMLKRHETLIEDLKVHGRKIQDLRQQAESCKRSPPAVTVRSEKKGALPVKNSKEKPEDHEEKESESKVISPVMKRQLELEEVYDDLMKTAKIRKNNLVNTHDSYVLMRECTEMRSWIDEKLPFVQQTGVGEDVAQVEALQKAFDDFKTETEEKKTKLIGMLTKIEKLLPFLSADVSKELASRSQVVEAKMEDLQELMKKRELQLSTAHELKRFFRDCHDAEEWVKEKAGKLDSDDCGDSLKSVRTLLRKHEGLERDLEALDERINDIEADGKYLVRRYPASSKDIKVKQMSLNEMFAQISRKAVFRKQNLLDSYDRQKFFADYDDLMSWMNNMTTIMSSSEGASNYHAAEQLRDHFERISSEIGENEMKIKTVQKYGEMLLNYNTDGVKQDIQQKLDGLKEAFRLLYEKKDLRQMVITKHLQINSFVWSCDKIKDWLADQEELLNKPEEEYKQMKTLKKIQDAILKKEKDIDYLKASAQNLVASFEEDKSEILENLKDTASRWEKLNEAVSKKLSELKENQTIHNFTLEVEAVASWIDEKLQQVLSEHHSEPVRIQSRLMKQKAFESEVHEHKERVENLLKTGRNLTRNEKSEMMRSGLLKLLEDISDQWVLLQQKTKETSDETKEVSKQYEHIMGIKYMNIWMSTVETTLMNRDLGKTLNVVEELLKQHVILEVEIGIHKTKMEALLDEVEIFKSDSIFDVVPIKEEHKLLKNRFERIEELAEQRKSLLEKKVNVLKYLRSVEEQEAWMKEMSARLSDTSDVNQLKFGFHLPKSVKDNIRNMNEPKYPSEQSSELSEKKCLDESLVYV